MVWANILWVGSQAFVQRGEIIHEQKLVSGMENAADRAATDYSRDICSLVDKRFDVYMFS